MLDGILEYLRAPLDILRLAISCGLRAHPIRAPFPQRGLTMRDARG